MIALCGVRHLGVPERIVDGRDAVQELIVQSGVEAIPDPGKPGAQIRDALSERLRVWDPWLQ